MAESSKKWKGASTSTATIGTWHHRASGAQPTPIPPSISSSMLFSSEEQCIRYNSLFASRSIIDPKLLDLEFFDDEMFDCFQAFQNSGLIQFMTIKLPYYPDLFRVFYSNLEIQNGTLISEVYGIKMIIGESLFIEFNCYLVKVYPLRAPLMMIGSLISLCLMPAGWFAPTKRIWPEGFLPVHWHSNAASCTTWLCESYSLDLPTLHRYLRKIWWSCGFS